MKKGIISAILVICAVFCLAGCGNKPSTLTCTQKVSTVEVELTANFVGNNVKAMSMKYEMDFSNYSDTLVNTLASKDYCSTVKSAMGSQFTLTDCKQNLEGKKLVITSGIDITTFSKSDLSGSPSATKSALEQQGYTCTLK